MARGISHQKLAFVLAVFALVEKMLRFYSKFDSLNLKLVYKFSRSKNWHAKRLRSVFRSGIQKTSWQVIARGASPWYPGKITSLNLTDSRWSSLRRFFLTRNVIWIISVGERSWKQWGACQNPVPLDLEIQSWNDILFLLLGTIVAKMRPQGLILAGKWPINCPHKFF